MKYKKEYQFESRHLHAVRRARGPGGKFLGKKDSIQACTTLHQDYKKNSPIQQPPQTLQKVTQYIVQKLQTQQKLVLKQITKRLENNDFLVPINIIEENFKDSFLWNLNEKISLNDFVEWYCEDKDLSEKYEKRILFSISEQIINFQNTFLNLKIVNEKKKNDDEKKEDSSDTDKKEDLESKNILESIQTDESLLVPIYLDIRLGDVHFLDQFEWDLCSNGSPEEFAMKLVKDMKLESEFIPLISFSVNEQLILHFQRILQGSGKPKKITGDFYDMSQEDSIIRDEETQEIWEPRLEKLSEDQLSELQQKEERKNRVNRRRTIKGVFD